MIIFVTFPKITVMAETLNFIKQNEADLIWWVDDAETIGEFLFSFDKKVVFNLFADYPQKLTKKQKALFDKENPYWTNFFKDRA